MILLNFSHPLTEAQKAEIENLTAKKIEKLFAFSVHFDNDAPFLPQLKELMAKIPLSGRAWQREALLVNLPAYNFAAALLLAELHGRMGYFPPILRLRPVPNSLPPRYEVAEILNLQEARNAARREREA